MTIRCERGFSLLEALIAAALFAAAAAVLFDFAATSQRLARPQPDAADLNQRMRVVEGMIARDLRAAGAGPVRGHAGTLSNYLPPIVPARTGALAADPELSAYGDRISILFVPADGWTTKLATDLASVDSDLPIDDAAAECPASGLCGFVPGMRAAIIDTSNVGKGYDTFTVTSAIGQLGHGPPNPPLSKRYAARTTIVAPLEQRVYFLERPTRRLMLYDGFRSTLPLVDNVVDLKFTYFIDPDPASVVLPADAEGSCAYGPGDPPIPLLATHGRTLKAIPLGDLKDGPFCGLPPNRFDADLLRIRRVRATIRMQAGQEQFRGRGKDLAIRDFEVMFHVMPRNMVAAK